MTGSSEALGQEELDAATAIENRRIEKSQIRKTTAWEFIRRGFYLISSNDK